MSKSTPEGRVVRAVLDFLAFRGIPHYRNNTGGVRASYKGRERFVRFGTVGWPDIVGVAPGGRFLGVECKAPGGKPKLSAEQQAVRKIIEDAGGLYIVAQCTLDVERGLEDKP